MAHNCENCGMRARYDNKPTSLLGRIWRWHINWCPGFKSYVKSMPDSDRAEILTKYDLTADKWKKMGSSTE